MILKCDVTVTHNSEIYTILPKDITEKKNMINNAM